MRISFVPLESLIIIGYISALLIGAVIGLLGGGGAILAVPVFVYLMGIEAVHATAYSLFLVGVTSGLGAIRYYRLGQVNFKAIIPFVIPSVIFLYLTRRYLLPFIPDPLLEGDGWQVSRRQFMMVFFALMMLVASISMFRRMRKPKEPVIRFSEKAVPWMISLWGTVIGLLAGIVGAGGGFMIVPVMILFLNLPMKMAVGTSLAIICIQSLTGFAGDLGTQLQMDWKFLFVFTLVAIVGMLAGTSLSKVLQPEKLRKLFAWFIFLMGLVIISIEII